MALLIYPLGSAKFSLLSEVMLIAMPAVHNTCLAGLRRRRRRKAACFPNENE